MFNEAKIPSQFNLQATSQTNKKSIPLVVVGYGNIGQQFIKILKKHKTIVEKQTNRTFNLIGVANSRNYQFTETCLLDDEIYLKDSNQQGQFIQQLNSFRGQPLVLIDLTASELIANLYLKFAENNWHIISANKIAAANHSYANEIESKISNNQRMWLRNTTVGAALPVQDSIKKIQLSGDVVQSVSGVFSGSLSWLFGKYDGKIPFMQWVKLAHENAYTEPDPRDDLSGQDVYRKAQILARELGFEPQQVIFKPVIPTELLTGAVEQFWLNQDEINSHIDQLWQQANVQNESLRYLASVNEQELHVELISVDSNHAASHLKPGDNIFIIKSEWYSDNPLVIQGPGAGREVTAAGVFNDLIDVLQSE